MGPRSEQPRQRYAHAALDSHCLHHRNTQSGRSAPLSGSIGVILGGSIIPIEAPNG